MMDKFLKSFECIICSQWPETPVKYCSIDGFVCRKCGEKIRHCPTCERDLLAEIPYLDMAFPETCQHRKNGCRIMMAKGDIVEHGKICDYQFINCCMLNCKRTDIIFNNFYHHLIAEHPSNFITFNFDVFIPLDLNKFDQQLPLLNFYILKEKKSGKLLMFKYCRDEGSLYFTVHYINNSLKARKYEYQVEFDQGRTLKFCLAGYCTPFLPYGEQMTKDQWVMTFNMKKNLFYARWPLSLTVRCKIAENEFF